MSATVSRFLIFFMLAIPVLVLGAVAKPPMVHWMDYEDALKKAEKGPKLIFVDLHAEWCVPCKVMEKTVYSDPTVSSLLNVRFYPVKLDVDSEKKIKCDGIEASVRSCFSEVWELSAIPAFVLLAPKGLSILTVTESMSVEEMKMLLYQFLEKEKEWMER